jgi:hypothetical protein
LNVNFRSVAARELRKAALVLTIAGGVAAAVVAVRLDRALEASKATVAQARERIRSLEGDAEAALRERARLEDELRGLKGEVAWFRAALADDSTETAEPTPPPAASPEGSAASPAPDPPPPDPRPAIQEREELFGADAPAVETMLALFAEERFEELATLADEETARNPDFTFAWIQGGLAYARLGEMDEARERLNVVQESAQDVDPRLVPYYRAAWFALEDTEH